MKKFLFLLGLLFALNFVLHVAHARARPGPNPSDDDDFFKNSEEDDDFFKSDAEEDDDAPPPKKMDERTLGGSGDGHDHSGHVMAMNQPQPPVANTNSDPKSGFSGGNVANYNETCDSKACNTDRNLKCDQSKAKPWRCACLDGHVYVRSQEKCYPTRRVEGQRCEFHEQCQNGPSGRLSRCNHQKGSCECYDHDLGWREVVLHNQVCVVKRKIGETCEADAECETTMKFNSYCSPPPQESGWTNGSEVCQCKKAYVWDNLLSECLKIADKGLTFDCKSSQQCYAGPMGNLSQCNPDTKKCECYDPKNPGPDNVRYYEPLGSCYERKAWNVTCSIHEECKASLSKDAECLVTKDDTGYGAMLLTCQCPQGKKCAPLGDGGGVEALKSINSLVVGMLLVYRCFIKG